MRKEIIHSSWEPLMYLLNQEEITQLDQLRQQKAIYPEDINVFRVFSMPLKEIKVVVLGQDPYHGRGQANGLAFAVNSNSSIPPSLRVIRTELIDSKIINIEEPTSLHKWKTLQHWEKQGVFLLNTALTVEEGKPQSHLLFWDNFISKVITFIGLNNPCIWLLWGKNAQKIVIRSLSYKEIERFDASKYTVENMHSIPLSPYYNYLFMSAHPAAEVYRDNAGFLGNDHFNKTNALLKLKNKTLINW